MDMKQYKVLQFPRVPETSLLGNLVIPSTVHSYSMCIEYMKDWFVRAVESGYGKGFFPDNSIYIDGKYIFDDFIRMKDIEKLKRDKPNLSIVPKIDHQYDKDKGYMKVLGLDRYIRKGTMYKGFFCDFDNNLCINTEMKTIQVSFDMNIRVSTRAQQMDLTEYLKLACRVGWTGGEEKDLDFHIPYELIMRVAKDAGFEIKDNKVVYPMRFLRYLNSNSCIPFLYKVRGINGNQEYFIRIKDCYIHTRFNSIDTDDGDRIGQVSSNFGISLNFLCTFPCPNFYIYYSKYRDDIPIGRIDSSTGTTIAAYAIKLTRFPDVDEHGWNLAMTCDIDEKDHSHPLSIDLEWLFKSDNDYNDILMMIKYCKDNFISPDIFINFRLYNMGDPVPVYIEWDSMKLETHTLVRGDINSLAIYIDYQFLNEQLVVLEQYYQNRIE